ncbi:LAGLIDADG DNA endonuclease [Trametes sanguinea]|nr:LAGLIDADG DNA endonuclease [Trametes sanguinea]
MNRIGPHNEDIFSVITGSLLGYAKKRSGEGVRICFRQSIRHKEYLGYTSNLQPRQYTRTIKSKEGKVYYGYKFNTFTFRSFSGLYKLFYINGKKVIPLNIYEYLTPLALAVWIMDDGGWANYGVRIDTNSFKFQEYNLDTTIQNIWIQNQYSIYIYINNLFII